MQRVDLILAVRNEEENLEFLYKEFSHLNVSDILFGLIIIEDGSNDNTVKLLRELSASKENVKYFSLSNPYGQGFALSFGIGVSDADAVITLDADGSHPFSVIEMMMNEYKNGDNVVQGHRITYDRENRLRKYFSLIFNGIFSLISGVNLLKQNVHFRLMDRKAINIFMNNKRWWYSARVNFNENIIKSTFVEFEAPERSLGESKYNFLRLVKMAIRLSYNLISTKRYLFLSSLLVGLIILISFLSPPMIILSPIIIINFYFYFKLNNEKFSKYKVLESNK